VISAVVVTERVAERVASRRRALGMNRDEFASRCNEHGLSMSLSIVTNIESGRRVQGAPRRAVTVDEMVVFAEVLGLHPLDLLGASDDRHDPDQALLGQLVERSVAKGRMRVLRGFGVAS
jgi:transcriptional regulator with XRE-family HTH domain